MPASRLRFLVVPLAAALLAACSGAAPSPSPQPDDSTPPDAAVRLRVTAVQALPPPATFNWMPWVVITLDGRVLTGGAVPAIYPGPLVNPVVERQITGNGWAKIVEAARSAGLLGLNRDFTGGQMPPGSQVTRLELVADGQLYNLIGDATRQMVCVQAPCGPGPGPPEAVGGFVNSLSDLTSLVGAAALGPEPKHNPAGYAVLVGDPPAQEPGLAQQAIEWPLAGGFAAFGKPLGDGSGGRCGLVQGADLALVRAAFAAANQLTRWRDATSGSFHGLTVRPLLPGDADPCEGLV